jgi:hypothetical protein
LGGDILRTTPARFYRTDDEFERFYDRLNLTPCPHCQAVGTLILHGKLYGYTENDDCRKACRGRRIFCNNRRRHRPGCGHTFTVWAAETIRRLRISAATLWTFIKLVLALRNKAQALRDSQVDFSVSSAYRLWKRFSGSQSHLRTALAARCPAPVLPRDRRPEAQTVAHLEAAFPGEPSPIAAFQHQLQLAFLS